LLFFNFNIFEKLRASLSRRATNKCSVQECKPGFQFQNSTKEAATTTATVKDLTTKRRIRRDKQLAKQNLPKVDKHLYEADERHCEEKEEEYQKQEADVEELNQEEGDEDKISNVSIHKARIVMIAIIAIITIIEMAVITP
jgi:hypothetical protein